MESVGRYRAVMLAGVRSFSREPTTLVLLVALPPIVIVTFDIAVDAMLDAPGIDLHPTTGEQAGALFATAFLAGVLSIFQIVGTMDADRRLVFAGYHPGEVLVARVGTIVIAGGLVTAIALVTFTWRSPIEIASLGWAVVGLLGAALIYGLIGVFVALLVRRELEGSLILVFLADFDAFLAIDLVPVTVTALEYLPLAGPYALFETAIHDGGVKSGELLLTAAWILVAGFGCAIVVSQRGEKE